MSKAFEILSDAIDEAIEDAKSADKKLERHEIFLVEESRSFKIKPELYETLSAIAEKSDETLDNLIEKILSDYVTKTA